MAVKQRQLVRLCAATETFLLGPPVVFGEIGQNVVVLVPLQQTVGGADVVVLQDGPVVVQHGRVRPAGEPPVSVCPAAPQSGAVIPSAARADAHLVWMWKLLVVPVCSKSWMAAANKVAKISSSLNQC